MFAQLSYNAGVPVANVLSDIATALTGGTIGGMTVSLNAGASSINNVPGGVATWQFVADSSTAISDSNAFTTGVTSIAAKVLRQQATTSIGTPDKFLKIAFAYFTATPTLAGMIGYLGKGATAGVLTGAVKYSNSNSNSAICNVATIASNNFVQAIRVQIYSSPTATLISIAEGDLFSFTTCLTVFDFARVNPDADTAGNLCSVITNGNTGDKATQLARNSYAHIPETTVNGAVYANGTQVVTSNRTMVYLGTPEIERYTAYPKR